MTSKNLTGSRARTPTNLRNGSIGLDSFGRKFSLARLNTDLELKQ